MTRHACPKCGRAAVLAVGVDAGACGWCYHGWGPVPAPVLKTYAHKPTGTRVLAWNRDHACELIELEMGVSDDGRSNGTRVQVDAEDVEAAL